MQFSTIHLLSFADPSIGRVDTTNMPHQTLMELLISKFNDKTVYRDSEGLFEDITTWDGITLNENGEVIKLQWEDSMDTFDIHAEEGTTDRYPTAGGSIDLKWLPSTLIDLNLSFLELQGTIETVDLPRGLTHFDITNNKFEGPFETNDLPKTLQVIMASTNKMSASLDLRRLPPALKHMDASKNAFSGTLDFSRLPQDLGCLRLYYNAFTGTIDLSGVPSKMSFLKIQMNRFDSQKVLTVRKGVFRGLIVDKGDIEVVINTDGRPVPFNIKGSVIQVMGNR